MTSFASGPVSALSLTNDARVLAAITDHNYVSFATPHVPPTPAPVSLKPHAHHITASSLTALAFPHVSALYTTDARGALSRYDASSDKPVQTFVIPAAHSGAELTAVAALSASSPVVTAGKDGAVRVWDSGRRQAIVKLSGHRYDVRSVAAASSVDDQTGTDVTIVASGGRDRTVRLWDVRQAGGGALHVFHGHTGWVHAVALAEGGDSDPVVVSCSGDRSVRVWDLRTLTQRAVYTGHQYRIWDVAVATGARFAASGSTDTSVRVWPVGIGAREEDVVVLEGHRDSVLAVCASRDGSFIAAGCEDGALMAWSGIGLFESPAEVNSSQPSGKGVMDQVTERTATNTAMEGVLVELDERPVERVANAVPKQLDNSKLPVEIAGGEEGNANIVNTANSPDALRSLTTERAEQDPRYDKSAAELVGALRRIHSLERDVCNMANQASERERKIAALEADSTAKDVEIDHLRKQVEAAKKMERAVEVRQLLAKDERKADVCVDYREPVNRIGAVSDQLSRLAERLDAMIATG